MTHEPIHTVHLTPHITWQGTQAELEAMQAEGWPVGSASEIIAACRRDAAEAEAYAAELEAKLKWVLGERDATFALMLKRAESAEAKLAKAVKALVKMVGKKYYADDPWGIASATLAELKGDKP
jgi:hypothetical protein